MKKSAANSIVSNVWFAAAGAVPGGPKAIFDFFLLSVEHFLLAGIFLSQR